MLTTLERNLGYGGASYTPVPAICRPAERDFLSEKGQQTTLAYSQMLRMSMEDCGDMEMESSYNDDVQRRRSSNGASLHENDEAVCLGRGGAVSPSPTSPPPAAYSRSHATNGGFTRTCKLCGTSKTPLWRSGPMGAKSLCNACGIRSNKARKLSAAVHESVEDQGDGDAGGDCSCSSFTGKPKIDLGLQQAASRESVTKRKKAEVDHDHGADKKQKQDGFLEENRVQKKQQRCGGVLVSRKQAQQATAVPWLQVSHGSLNSTTPSAGSPVKTESSSCVTSQGTPSPCSTRRRTKVRDLHYCSMEMEVPGAGLELDDDGADSEDEEQAALLLMALSCGLVLA